MKYLLVLALMFMSACTSLTINDENVTFAEFTVADLQGAQALALADNDEVARLCYVELEKFVVSRGAVTVGEATLGAFSKFQRLRMTRRHIDQGVPEEINTRCAPLIVDAGKTLIRIRRLVTPGIF